MLKRLAGLALALIVASSVASAAVGSLTGYVTTVPQVDPRFRQGFQTPAGETGQINLAVLTTAGAAYDLTGAQILLTVRQVGTGAIFISRQATINVPAANGTCYFPLTVGDTAALATPYSAGYNYDVWVTDSQGNRYQVVPTSTFAVTQVQGQPGQGVTAPPAQLPLAQGPAGFPAVVENNLTTLTAQLALSVDGTLLQFSNDVPNNRTQLLAPGLVPKTRNVATALPLTGGNTLAGDLALACPTCAVTSDTRFPPTPSAAGAPVYDNGSGYSKSSPGTTSQVLIGGASPSFGLVPDGAMPNKGPGPRFAATTRQIIASATADAAGRIATLGAINNMVNVYSFGAKCDGTTDDYAAIQMAIDSCRDSKACAVYVPGSPASTSCITNTTILLTTRLGHRYDGIQIVGDGPGASWIKAGHAFLGGGCQGPICFQGGSFGDLKNIGIRDIRVSGFDTTTTGVAPVVSFGDTSGGFAIHVEIDTNGDAEAIYFNDPSSDENCLVANSYFTQIGGWGVPTAGTGRSAINTNCSHSVVIGNTAFQVGSFMEQTGEDFIVVGNSFDFAGVQSGAILTTGATLESPGAPSGTHGRGVFALNTLGHTGTAVGVGGQSTGGILVAYNSIYNSDTGVDLLSGVTGNPNIADGNFFQGTNSGSQGAAIICGTNTVGACSIKNNRIVRDSSPPWAYGIYVPSATAAAVVSGNEIWGDATTTADFYVVTWPPTAQVDLIGNSVHDPAGTIPASRTIYRLGSDAFTVATYGVGIYWDDTRISNVEPSRLHLAAPPAVSTWPVRSSEIINTAPTPGGTQEWILTTAGACPGTCVWSALTLN